MSKKTNKATRTGATELTGDAESLVAALERLRAGKFDVAEMTVGGASIKLHRPPVADDDDREDKRPESAGIHEQFGGELFRRVTGEQVPGVEFQPAIGRRAG